MAAVLATVCSVLYCCLIVTNFAHASRSISPITPQHLTWRPAIPDPQTSSASLARFSDFKPITPVERSPSPSSLSNSSLTIGPEPNAFYALIQNEDLLTAGRDSLKVFVKSLRANRSLDEALTIAVTAFATTRTAREIKHSMNKNAKFLLDKEHFDLSKSLNFLALGGLAVLPPIVFPKYFRSMDEAWFAENRQIQKFLTNSLVGASEDLSRSVMGWIEKSVDDLPSFPRLDAQECMKRCVCEAHNQPKKYGVMGLVLQLFFPPYTETDEPSRTVSKYQLAARYGRQDNANCAAQYDGCVVNFLDAFHGLINFFF